MKAMKSLRGAAVGAAAVLSHTVVLAQDAPASEAPRVADYFYDPMFYLAVLVALILVLVIYAMANAIQALTRQIVPPPPKEELAKAAAIAVAAKPKRRSSWTKLMDLLTRSVPVAQEKDILLDHDYDGIQELDNQLPPWWKWGFYITILFAAIYLLYYHVSGSGKLMAAEYKDEMDKAAMEKEMRMKEAKNFVTEENVAVLTGAEELAAGKSIFTANCVTCHGEHAQGTPTAPNLTDAYWLHGGSIKNLFHTITTGVPGKAMISWAQKLSPIQINEVASYILSLQGSNPPDAKQPEGDLYTPETATAAAPGTDTVSQAAPMQN
jgi:cytochrome c oxidase cbb3-type subunit 3